MTLLKIPVCPECQCGGAMKLVIRNYDGQYYIDKEPRIRIYFNCENCYHTKDIQEMIDGDE